MHTTITEKDLPHALGIKDAVAAAYPEQVAETALALQRRVPVLVECEKELAPFFFLLVRERLQQEGMECDYLDGRAEQENAEGVYLPGLMAAMTAQLRRAVRGAGEHRVLVLPHCDLLTAGPGGLTAEGREVIALLYENPALVWLGFRDPTVTLPAAVEELFPRRVSALGIPRSRLAHLITRREAKKFGTPLHVARLHRHVSGLNAVRLRKVLAAVEREDHPPDPARVLAQLRQATLTGDLTVPAETLDRDVGGYATVKRYLHEELLDVLALRDEAEETGELARLDELLPRGLIFAGPGTGKQFFARALAGSLGAALVQTSTPELKSRYFGGSEENLRRLFHRARRAAPALILFDELDTLASPPAGGTGVERSMLAQLLTEMDRLPREELVFVAGTTEHPDRLDPALFRPGRFELVARLPYPGPEDRKEILQIHDTKMHLRFTEEALSRAVELTAGDVPGAPEGTRFGASHLHALCRGIARSRLRARRADPTGPEDVEAALRALPGPPC
jgi:cell division protease FtsH